MKCTEFQYSFKSKMNKILEERVKEMYDNFSVFKTWEDETLKNFANKLRSKIMNKEEVLFDDGIRAEYVYFITRGALRMEKEVRTKDVKFWPVDKKQWQENITRQNVIFKIDVIRPFNIIGEHQAMSNKPEPYPVKIVAEEDNTRVFYSHRRDII